MAELQIKPKVFTVGGEALVLTQVKYIRPGAARSPSWSVERGPELVQEIGLHAWRAGERYYGPGGGLSNGWCAAPIASLTADCPHLPAWRRTHEVIPAADVREDERAAWFGGAKKDSLEASLDGGDGSPSYYWYETRSKADIQKSTGVALVRLPRPAVKLTWRDAYQVIPGDQLRPGEEYAPFGTSVAVAEHTVEDGYQKAVKQGYTLRSWFTWLLGKTPAPVVPGAVLVAIPRPDPKKAWREKYAVVTGKEVLPGEAVASFGYTKPEELVEVLDGGKNPDVFNWSRGPVTGVSAIVRLPRPAAPAVTVTNPTCPAPAAPEKAESKWILWSPDSNKPVTKTYETEKQARAVAEKMAKIHPGQKFYIARLEGCCEADRVKWEA